MFHDSFACLPASSVCDCHHGFVFMINKSILIHFYSYTSLIIRLRTQRESKQIDWRHVLLMSRFFPLSLSPFSFYHHSIAFHACAWVRDCNPTASLIRYCSMSIKSALSDSVPILVCAFLFSLFCSYSYSFENGENNSARVEKVIHDPTCCIAIYMSFLFLHSHACICSFMLFHSRYMDKRLSFQLNANRKISGVLRGYDAFMNLVIDEATEEISATESVPIGMVASQKK